MRLSIMIKPVHYTKKTLTAHVRNLPEGNPSADMHLVQQL